MKAALLVIDIQRWFFRRDWFSTPDGQARLQSLIAKTNELIDYFQGRRLPIIHILTVHKRDGSTRDLWMRRNDRWSLVEGTAEAQELPDIHRYETDVEVIKTRSDSFLRTELEDTLKQQKVDTVVVAGYSTNRCVGVTALEACERDFDVFVSRDAILGAEQSRADAMLSILRNEFGMEPISNEQIMERLAVSDK